uniref:Forkhead box protein O n=1 Tax=Trichobilharzia regenti TaxID=157069 RepID=A0AA85ITN5_TRIRE|nr:unnamed protein product [Trichobilharzia regenti]
MSASYIRRDTTLVSNPCPLSILSTGPSSASSSSCISANEHHTIRSYSDQTGMPSKHSPATALQQQQQQQPSQASMHSPKMSPDSTLTQLSSTPSSFMSYLNSSTSLSGSLLSSSSSLLSNGNPISCDSFLRTALLSDNNYNLDKQCVGSTTNLMTTSGVNSSNSIPNFHDPINNHLSSSNTIQPCSLLRPRAMTTSNASRSGTPAGGGNNTPTSGGGGGGGSGAGVVGSSVCASAPTSTTPIKKSSRRNPWGSETYSDLISVAIRSYPDKQATLQQIYDFIITHYEYFRERSDPTSSAGWKNSIRHNLSLHDRFTKCPKSSDNTKSSYWRINPDVAAKPYVRRRACSMDTTNLKRPSHYGKMNNRSGGAGGGGVAHRSNASNNNNNNNNNSSMTGHHHRLQVPSTDNNEAMKLSLSPVCELQQQQQHHPLDFNNYASSKLACNRSDTTGTDCNSNNSRLASSTSPSTDTCSTTKSMHFYHCTQQSNTTNDTLCDNNNNPLISSHWQNPKALTHHHHQQQQQAYNSNATSGGGGGGNNIFNSGFSGLSCSTDLPPNRCGRTSGLIEQLLRNDHTIGMNNSTTMHTIDRLSSDHYPTNLFPSCHSGKSSLTTGINNNTSMCNSLQQMDTLNCSDYLSGNSSTLEAASSSLSHMDLIRQHHQHQQQQQQQHQQQHQHQQHQQSLHHSSAAAAALLSHINNNPSRGSSNNASAHHLLPVPLLTSGGGSEQHHGSSSAAATAAAAAAQSYWQAAYRSSASSCFYPVGGHYNPSISSTPIGTGVGGGGNNSFTASFYDTSSHLLHSAASNDTGGGKLLPFLNSCSSSASNGPTTPSSSSPPPATTSVNSWRHSLGLDMRLFSDTHNSQRSTVADHPMPPLSSSSSSASLSCSVQNNSVLENTNRSLGPVTPPDLMYFPQTTSLFNMESSSSYQQQQQQQQSKQDNDDNDTLMTEELCNLGRSNRSLMNTAYETPQQQQQQQQNSSTPPPPSSTSTSSSSPPASASTSVAASASVSAFTANLNQSSRPPSIINDRTTCREMRQYIEAYNTAASSYEDDCEPLELELSLELADRIVGSTSVGTSTANPITSSYGCPPAPN